MILQIYIGLIFLMSGTTGYLLHKLYVFDEIRIDGIDILLCIISSIIGPFVFLFMIFVFLNDSIKNKNIVIYRKKKKITTIKKW